MWQIVTIASCYVASCDVASCYLASCEVASCDVASCYVANGQGHSIFCFVKKLNSNLCLNSI
jgi:hypothetical protein